MTDGDAVRDNEKNEISTVILVQAVRLLCYEPQHEGIGL